VTSEQPRRAGLVRRAISAIMRPVNRLLVRLVRVPDQWERFDVVPRLAHFGSGARHEFGWYFEGESAVAVADLAELQRWLGDCAYAADPQLFQESDFWQHPRTFEQLRRGDCEDFALWAWRKLVELGYDADLVVGRSIVPAERAGRHAWVMFRRDGVEYLYEPVLGAHPGAVQPLANVREHYVPEFGVGPDRKPFTFAGWLHFRKNPQLGRSGPPDAA
jgi:hypothetical protein